MFDDIGKSLTSKFGLQRGLLELLNTFSMSLTLSFVRYTGLGLPRGGSRPLLGVEDEVGEDGRKEGLDELGCIPARVLGPL